MFRCALSKGGSRDTALAVSQVSQVSRANKGQMQGAVACRLLLHPLRDPTDAAPGPFGDLWVAMLRGLLAACTARRGRPELREFTGSSAETVEHLAPFGGRDADVADESHDV